jgi:hypothetical protein
MTYKIRVVNTFRSLFPKKGGFFLTLKKPSQIKGVNLKKYSNLDKFNLGESLALRPSNRVSSALSIY